LSIWAQNINYFPAFDYIIYNNSAMKNEWLENNLKLIGFYEHIYLQYSLDGRDIQKWNREFNIEEMNRKYNRKTIYITQYMEQIF
jgi:hypothetical protein